MEELLPMPAEKAIVAGLSADLFTKEEQATERTLDELEALLQTAGGVCVGRLLQNRHAPDPHSFLGEGKAQELRELVDGTGAGMVVFDNDLSPSQLRALEDLTGAVVLDRSALILDIFAQRAKTKEGRLQVELAQYQYLLPRLSGMGKSLSRQGGGIGTRGPGETKLETDRRHIRQRIDILRRELREVRQVRGVQRERRIKANTPVVCLVGYTNAGKSTLLNRLTGAGIPANDRLFDTLDTTSRQLAVTDTLQVILSDTVGFIAKLPHNLVEAFQATLEELQFADLLIHVIDASDPEREEHAAVVEKLIESLARPGVPVIDCYNKCDLAEGPLPHATHTAAISAKTGSGLDALLDMVARELDSRMHRVRLLIPYDAGGAVDLLHQKGRILSSSYEPEGLLAEALLDDMLLGKLAPYVRA